MSDQWGILSAMGVEGVLRRQAGVISRRQAVAEGLSGSTVAARVAAGLWRALHPGVYLARTHELTSEASVRAAMLWAGAGAALGGPAAA